MLLMSGLEFFYFYLVFKVSYLIFRCFIFERNRFIDFIYNGKFKGVFSEKLFYNFLV